MARDIPPYRPPLDSHRGIFLRVMWCRVGGYMLRPEWAELARKHGVSITNMDAAL